MPPPAPDRAVRRLVADLAATRPEDIEAILDELDDGQRSRVRTLLGEYLGAHQAPAAGMPVERPRPVVIEGLSPWLAARLERAQPAGVAPPRRRPGRPRDQFGRDMGLTFDMTPGALETLHACAAAIHARRPTPQAEAEGLLRFLPARLRQMLPVRAS
jgi:hypothetical protein